MPPHDLGSHHPRAIFTQTVALASAPGVLAYLRPRNSIALRTFPKELYGKAKGHGDP
jgi:hypothetical protein